jgi:hypothetical protein
MTTTAQAGAVVVDGDPAFYRVNTRTPAHALEPGVCADAVNKRFEDGRAWPRLDVEREPWGDVKSLRDHVSGDFNVCAYARYSDPNGFEVTVLVTDEWRTAAAVVGEAPTLPGLGAEGGNGLGGEGGEGLGEEGGAGGAGGASDGGRGRVWLIMSGNGPKEVPLNGNDVWDTARLVPCNNGLVLLRWGNERHYFGAAAVVAANRIRLNAPQAWANGDAVLIGGDANSTFTGGALGVALNTLYFVKVEANNVVGLYRDSGLTLPLDFTGAVGRFYLERQATQPGFYGNGAPPLLAQPNAIGNTLWDVGFLPVPVNLQVTNTSITFAIFTVPNHRLVPGDEVVLAGMPAGHTPANGTWYAYPLNDHQLELYDTQVNAMLAANGSEVGLQVISNNGEHLAYLVKGGASSLPMPPAHEGFYTETNQLVLVNGANNICISDPNDPLHYTPFQASLTAQLGESGGVVAVSTFQAADCLVFLKSDSILALYNFAEGAAQWALRSVTLEYGCKAALSVRQWGNRLTFLSRRGLDCVMLSAFGVILPVEKPISFDLKKYIDLIDWPNAGQAVVETWNNRLFLAVPKRGQAGKAGTGKVESRNSMVLVLNYLNSEPQKDIFGWEGVWQGAALQVAGWARCDVYGESRLSFVDYAGQVNWLGDGWLDVGNIPIADSLTTRIYGGADKGRKKWLKGLVVWDTNGPTLTVTAVSPGYNERQPLLTDLVYDRTQYLDGSGAVYDPATQRPAFNTPNRADYSLAGPGELIGGVPNVHQNIPETVRLRVDDWGVQLLIENKTGSCRLVSVELEGVRGPRAGTRVV